MVTSGLTILELSSAAERFYDTEKVEVSESSAPTKSFLTYASMNKLVKLEGLSPLAHIRNVLGSSPSRGTKVKRNIKILFAFHFITLFTDLEYKTSFI